MSYVYILIGKPEAIGLMDTGSSGSLISLDYAKRHQIKVKLAAGYVSVADIFLERAEKIFFSLLTIQTSHSTWIQIVNVEATRPSSFSVLVEWVMFLDER